VSSEVNTEAEATAEHQAHHTTECLICGVQAKATDILYNIAKLHGSSLVDKMNIWFALRIRKTVTEVMEQHVNIMAVHLMTGTWTVILIDPECRL
jgi:hypothetical protein